MAWQYAGAGNMAISIEKEELDRLMANGQLPPDTMVLPPDSNAWVRYSEIAAVERARCAECGGLFPVDDMIDYSGMKVCAGCKEVFFQKIREGVSVGGAFAYAGFWIRFGARFVDNILLGVFNGVVTFSFGWVFASSIDDSPLLMFVPSVFGWVVQITYETYFIAKFGQTIGKKLARVKIVRSDGSPVGTARAFGRFWAVQLSTMTLLIGYIMAAFDSEKRALHDRICDTRVIRVD